MRRLLLLCVLCGCASSGTPVIESSTPKQATIYQGEGGTILAERPRAAVAAIAAPPATVWLAAKKVYADLDVPITIENPSGHQMGNQNFFKSRQFASGQYMMQRRQPFLAVHFSSMTCATLYIQVGSFSYAATAGLPTCSSTLFFSAHSLAIS